MASCHRRRREAELKKALGVPGLPRQLFANALMAGLARRSWFRRGLSQQSVRRNAIADDADSAVPLALDKGLPFGIADKLGATVTNRARSDTFPPQPPRSSPIPLPPPPPPRSPPSP